MEPAHARIIEPEAPPSSRMPSHEAEQEEDHIDPPATTQETLGLEGAVSTEDSTNAEDTILNGVAAVENAPSFVVDLPENDKSDKSKVVETDSFFDIDTEALNKGVSLYIESPDRHELDHFKGLGSIWGLQKSLKTNLKNGLDKESLCVAERIKAFGSNRVPRPTLLSFWKLCMQAFNDFILIILVVAGFISLLAGIFTGKNPETDWVEGFAIWVAVAIVVLVTAANDWGRQKQFEKLSALKDAKKCNVLRNGTLEEMSVFDVLVGDVLVIEAGDEVAADCVVITSDRLKIDESSLTGESDAINKLSLELCLEEQDAYRAAVEAGSATGSITKRVHTPVALSGSSVSTGTGRLLVVATGVNSTAGSLFLKLNTGFESTPLQNKLNALAHHIGAVGLGSAITTFVILFAQFWIMYFLGGGGPLPDSTLVDHVEFAIIGITVIVVAVPEGLPLAVTIALAYSINRMLEDQNFVRRLHACEVMGGADEICSDKTGTLTENKMTVHSVWNGTTFAMVPEADEPMAMPFNEAYMEPFVVGMAINNTGYLQKEEVSLDVGKKQTSEIIVRVGSSTECALLFYLARLGYDYNQLRQQFGGEQNVVHVEYFSSQRKMMTTVVKLKGEQAGKYRVYVKGAAEKVLGLCKNKVDGRGTLKSVSPSEKKHIEKFVIHQMASLALRPICLAYKDFDAESDIDWKQFDDEMGVYQMEKDLTCLSIVGISDPVRRGVPGAIRQCHGAGIKVRMITGDNIETAKQIAISCDIYHPEAGGIAMLGTEFYKTVGGVICNLCKVETCNCPVDEATAASQHKRMREDVLGNMLAFQAIAGKLEVLARSQPRDKYALVIGLKAIGSVVAVTGDGTNDAPALKKADVGFAMGITGKEVAKLAADIVILDDNFESVVKAVKWGRSIFENIRRFLSFQLTVNVVAVSFTMITALLIRTSPLTAIQLLWVNLIMDTFASLALATEPPTDELLLRKPTKRNEYLISKSMFGFILSQALYQLCVLFILVFAGDLFLPEIPWKGTTELQRQEFNFCEFAGGSPDNCVGDYVRSGRLFHIFSPTEDYTSDFVHFFGPSRHMTVVFNTFVWLQIFNLLNARNPNRNWNILKGILSSKMWLIIFFGIVLCQSLIIQFGNIVMSCHKEGLTSAQWGICIAFGFGGIIVHQAMKMFPVAVLPQAGKQEIDPLDEPKSFALASRGRISREKVSRRLSVKLDEASGSVGEMVKRSQTQMFSQKKFVMRSSTLKL